MKLVVDAMGGDNAPMSTVKGSVEAVNQFNVHIILVGYKSIIEKELSKYNYNNQLIDIIDADEIIENDEEPAMAIRRKKKSSMVVGLNLVKEGYADGIISAGNTGALLSGGILIVKRIKGIDRGALASVYPTKKGISLLIDAGANADCKAKYLQQFAVMGSVYCQRILKIESPKVGLVNVGVEKGKGNELYKSTYDLLERTNVNFIGNLEARDIPKGHADVIVCDGFTGNVILKLTEGLAYTIFSTLKDEFTKNFFTKLGAFILKSRLKNFKKRLDYSEYGGAPLLGVKGAVIKAHGSSDSKAIMNAIRQGILFVENNVVEKIEADISALEN